MSQTLKRIVINVFAASKTLQRQDPLEKRFKGSSLLKTTARAKTKCKQLHISCLKPLESFYHTQFLYMLMDKKSAKKYVVSIEEASSLVDVTKAKRRNLLSFFNGEDRRSFLL